MTPEVEGPASDHDWHVDPPPGRLPEVARLHHALQRCRAGRGGAVLLVGDAGSGKTTLATWAAAEAAANGALALRAPGFSLASNTPYAPLVAALTGVVRASEHAAAVRGLDALGTLFDGVGPTDAGEVLEGTGRVRLHDALATLLGRLCRDRPVVLVADDLHWYDHASLEVLGLVAHDAPEQSLLVVGAHRAFETSERAEPRALLRSLRRTEGTIEIEVGGLDHAAVEQLLVGRLGPVVAAHVTDEIWRRSGGTPLFALELIDDLLRRGALRRHGGLWQLDDTAKGAASSTLAALADDLIGDRIDNANDAEHMVLHLVAVAGGPLPDDHLEQLDRLDEPDRRAATQQLCQRRLLEEVVDPYGKVAWVTAHPIVTEAVLSRLTVSEQRTLHLRFLDVLGASPPDLLGQHLLGAGPLARAPEHIDLLLSAARHALEQGAPIEASRLLVAAGERVDPAHDGLRAVAIAEQLAIARDRRGEHHLAAEQLRWALDCHRAAGDLRGQARVLSALLDQAWQTAHDNDDLQHEVLGLLSTLEDEGEWESATHLTASYLNVSVRSGSMDGFDGWIDRLRTVAARAGTSSALLLADMFSWMLLFRPGMVVRDLDEALDTVSERAMAHGHLAQRVLLARFDVAMLDGDIGRIRRMLEREIDDALRAGRVPSWRTGMARFDLALARGDLATATEIDVGDLSPRRDRSHGFSHMVRVLVEVAADDLETARVQVARWEAERLDENDAIVSYLLDVAHLLVGDDGADEAAERLADPARGPSFVAGLAWIVDVAPAVAQLRLGRHDALAEQLALLRSAGGRRAAYGEVIRSHHEPDPTAAARHLLEAARRLDELGRTFEGARCRVHAAERCQGSSEPATLVEAAAILTSTGRARLEQRAASVLRAHRLAPRRHSATVDELGLTTREREVAEAVSSGLSNREVAAALFISVRTVTSHLDHIYTKLGIGSRAELASLLGAGT